MDITRIGIVGGGAAGIFAAIHAAETARKKKMNVHVQVFEASNRFLNKVAISGGGRCNVTYHCFEPDVFCKSYPRGCKELISPMQKFQAKDTVAWFESRGVKLKTEDDGRIFPTTDHSSTIIDCLMGEVERNRIELLPRQAIERIRFEKNQYTLTANKKNEFTAQAVLIATGSSPVGYKLAKQLGHTIEDLAPSLFSFHIQHPLLQNLEGISFPKASVELILPDGKKFSEKAPVLITHWGLSGPGILKLSAWAAREMKKAGYKAKLFVNWLDEKNIETSGKLLLGLKEKNAKSNIANIYPTGLTRRFWENLLTVNKIPLDMQWAQISKSMLESLSRGLCKMEFDVNGKSRHKEEFVECGGVSLKEIDWKTMESKISKGLYFAGEIMDVDGITGGFNLQHAWTTGFLVGTNMIK